MSKWQQIIEHPLYLYLIPLGVGVGAVLWWFGCLGKRSLARGPRRRVDLGPIDLLIGLGLWVVGQSAAGVFLGVVLATLGQGDTEAGPATELAQAGGIILGQLLAYLPPLGYLVWKAIDAQDGIRQIGLLPRHVLGDLKAAALGLLCALPLVLASIGMTIVLGILIGRPAPPVGHEMLQLLTESQSPLATTLFVTAALIVAPPLEECLFRGLMQTAVLGMVGGAGGARRWTAVMIVAGVFAIIHMGAVTWHALPGLFVLALVLGYLYERTGSLWPPILVHGGFNAFNIGCVLLLPDGG